MDLEVNWIESLLKTKSYNESPIKVIDVQVESAVGRWENYLSTIKRVKAKTLLGSGKQQNISLIIKDQHTSHGLKQMTVNGGFFIREIMMYRDILPKMKDILEEVGDRQGVLWPDCFGVRLYNQLVFEDLSASGYCMLNRKALMDLNTAAFTLKQLAKFHALSKVLLANSELPLDVFGKTAWSNHGETDRMTKSYMTKLIKEMDNWGDEWKDAQTRLNRIMPEMAAKFEKNITPDADEFTVLNHGDCWTNNMLFKTVPSSNCPINLKFIDLQNCYVASPILDLHYFLITSVKIDVQKCSLDSLLATYCEALRTNLMKFGYEGHIPNEEELKKMFVKTAIAQLWYAIIFTPIIIGDHDHLPDFEEIISKEFKAAEKQEESPGLWNVYDHLNETSKTIVQYAIQNAMQQNVI